MNHSEARERWKLGKSLSKETQQQSVTQVSSAAFAYVQEEKDNHQDNNDNDQNCKKPRRSKLSNRTLFHSRKASKVPSSKSATKSSSSSIITNEDDRTNEVDFVARSSSVELSVDHNTIVDTFGPATETNDDSTAAKKQPIFFSKTAARLVVSQVPSPVAGEVSNNNQKPNPDAAADIPIATPIEPSKPPDGRRLRGWKLLAVVAAVLLVVVAIVVGVAVGVTNRSQPSSLSSSRNEPSESEPRPSLRPSLSPSVLQTMAPSINTTVPPNATLAPSIILESTYAPSLLTLEPLPQPTNDPTNRNEPTQILSSGQPSTKQSQSLPPTPIPNVLLTIGPSIPTVLQKLTLQPTINFLSTVPTVGSSSLSSSRKPTTASSSSRPQTRTPTGPPASFLQTPTPFPTSESTLNPTLVLGGSTPDPTRIVKLL